MPTVNVEFDDSLFNDVFWHLDADFNNPAIRFIWLYGGSSASKTYTVVQRIIYGMLTSSDDNTMVLRKIGSDIKDSIYSEFKGIISAWGLNEYFECQQNYIKCISGSYIRFRGLDDSEKVKGIVNFKRIYLNEISQFDLEDFNQVRLRLRGRANQQIILDFNPIDEDHWVKVSVFDHIGLINIPLGENERMTEKLISENGDSVVYKLTYLDNKYITGPHNIDEHTIKLFEFYKKTDFNLYNIYALGNWGRIRTGGEAYKKFNTSIHVRACPYNPELPLHITFDFNVNPYITCLVWQAEGLQLRQINEFCLPDPRNRTKDACMEVERVYMNHDAGMFIYGDPSGKNEDTKTEKGENNFTLITKYLAKFRPSLRVDSKAPSVVMRINFINSIFESNFEGCEILIDPKCKETIKDLSFCLEASDGTKDKSKVKHPVTGVSYEKHGHCSDALDYLAVRFFYSQFLNYQRGDRIKPYIIGKRIN